MSLSMVIAAFVGALSWSFSEYAIHRWLGHDKHLLKNPFGVEHTAHHGKGDYFAPWWKKAGAALALTALVWFPATMLAGLAVGGSWIAGFIAFYLVYEVMHRLEHVHEGIGAYGRWARRHHYFHHFHDPSKNHGVTSPIWDWVFGTYVPAPQIRVPKKLAMRWLCDPETGDVWPHLAPYYELRLPKRRRSLAA
ncbi:MAG: sterol desaturase family protein [Myxococcales bacterium]|nr:sterol desaturase family protein [Myxococcales bacterium]